MQLVNVICVHQLLILTFRLKTVIGRKKKQMYKQTGNIKRDERREETRKKTEV
jgi:hypothetical protein